MYIYIYIYICIYTGWWFQTFFVFHNLWDNPSHWIIFFKMVKTTNQLYHHWRFIFFESERRPPLTGYFPFIPPLNSIEIHFLSHWIHENCHKYCMKYHKSSLFPIFSHVIPRNSHDFRCFGPPKKKKKTRRLTSGDAPVADRVKSLEKDPELVPWMPWKSLRFLGCPTGC